MADSGSQTTDSSCFIENSNGLFLKGYLNLSAREDPGELHKLLVPSCCVSFSEHSTDRAADGRDPSALKYLTFTSDTLLPELSVPVRKAALQQLIKTTHLLRGFVYFR